MRRRFGPSLQPEKESAIQSTGLGRVEAQIYQWSPDGHSLLFAGTNSLALLDLRTNAAKPLVSFPDPISDPKFSPDGNWVSFVRASNLWLVNIASGESKALTTGGSEDLLKGQLDWVYPEELDCATAYWWSPDSSKIAYYIMDERPVTRYPIMDMSSPVGAIEYTRFPEAGKPNPIVRVGVVRRCRRAKRKWMDTGADTNVYIPRVNWLPDSQRVAIQRLNRAQNRLDLLFDDVATANRKPFPRKRTSIGSTSTTISIFSRMASASCGRVSKRVFGTIISTIFLASSSSNSRREIGASLELAGSAQVRPAIQQLMKSMARSISAQTKIIRSKHSSTASRSTIRAITRITTAAGTHDVLISPDASAFVDAFSKAMTPPRQDLYRTDGARVAVINENKVPELAEYELSPIEFLTVDADDGTKLEAKIIKPPDFDANKKYPVLITVYGGPQAQEVRDAWGSPLWSEMLAEKGYIVFSLDNRGSYNRGHAFETPIFHHFGKIELEDQLSGVKYLKSLPYVDGSRIGIWGWSYGGYMTLYALANAPDVFKAGVSVAPVSDWRLYDTIYTERYMGLPQENPEGYRDSSPVNQADHLTAKLMMAHGTGDDNVHFENTSEMLNELIDSERYATELMIFPGRGHPIGDHAATVLLFKHIAQFISDHL